MKTSTYRQAQQSYDRQEHPDYWREDEEEDDRKVIVNLMHRVARGPFFQDRRTK